MVTIQAAVVGVGQFGKKHAAKYKALQGVELVAVADIDSARAEEAAGAFGVPAVTDYRDLAGRVDAVSVVVPTAEHHRVARFFLDNGVHVLVEKPIARDLAEADDLIRRARARGLVLQVGHLERFYASEIGLDAGAQQPLYIEAQRVAPFSIRGTDVSVVLDMMIHDIDMALSLVGTPVEHVDAIGAPVLSHEPDIVNTRLKFANGSVATIVASRIAQKSERRLRIFRHDCMILVDLLERRVLTVRKNDVASVPSVFPSGMDGFVTEERAFPECDPLEAEIAAFVEAVANGREPVVTGEEGLRALDTAIRIGDSLQAHLAKVRQNLPAGHGAQ